MNEILEKIENSIPENVRFNLKRRLVTQSSLIIELASQLKQMSENNYDIISILFKNNDDALYFSGDILAKTLHDFWTKNGSIYDFFMENAKATSYVNGFKCLWN